MKLLCIFIGIGLICSGLTVAYILMRLLIETVNERRNKARCVRSVQQQQHALGVRERITGEAIAARSRGSAKKKVK